MTDTQFKVGETYATRGGDRVRVTEIRNRGVIYPVCGDFLDGGATGQPGAWTLGGKFSTAAIETPCDLLPGALPTPIPEAPDDKAELLAALREIADMREDEDGFNPRTMQRIARAAIAKAERTS